MHNGSVPHPNVLPDKLQRNIASKYMKAKKLAEHREDILHCPPIDPRLIAHLQFKFQDPSRVAKPTNPMLAQLLTIQYGCDKVLQYLETQYDIQSQAVREEREKV